MQQAKEYLRQFQQATTAEARQVVVNAYHVHYETLTDQERAQADDVMRVLWPAIEQKAAELEPLLERLNALLPKKDMVRAE